MLAPLQRAPIECDREAECASPDIRNRQHKGSGAGERDERCKQQLRHTAILWYARETAATRQSRRGSGQPG